MINKIRYVDYMINTIQSQTKYTVVIKTNVVAAKSCKQAAPSTIIHDKSSGVYPNAEVSVLSDVFHQ